jgi:hypothetical protein
MTVVAGMTMTVVAGGIISIVAIGRGIHGVMNGSGSRRIKSKGGPHQMWGSLFYATLR